MTQLSITDVAVILERFIRIHPNGKCLTKYREEVDLSKHIPYEIRMELMRMEGIRPDIKDVATALRDLIVNPTDRDTIIRAHAALEGTGVRLPE